MSEKLLSIPAHLGTTPAVVLNSGPAGLAGTRSLGRAGVRVTNVDFAAGPASKSRYCDFRSCPHPGTDPSGVLEILRSVASAHGPKPVLFPASDQFFALVSEHRESLAEHFRMALPPPEASAAMLDKRRQYEIAQDAGIDCAKTIYPETADDVSRMSGELDYPAFIKPHEGHLWRRHFENKGFVVNSPAELERQCATIFPLGVAFMVQSFILGPASNSYSGSFYIGTSGDCLASFTARKLRQFAVDAGVGTLVESVSSPELIDLGLRVCRMLQYRGIAEIEFKKDDRDGKLKFIELNPRLWVQSALATSAGVDFARVQYLDVLGFPPPPVTKFRTGVLWLDSVRDYKACRTLLRQGKLSAADWVQSWMRARSFASFAPDDPKPFLDAARGPMHEIVTSGMRRLGMRNLR